MLFYFTTEDTKSTEFDFGYEKFFTAMDAMVTLRAQSAFLCVFAPSRETFFTATVAKVSLGAQFESHVILFFHRGHK